MDEDRTEQHRAGATHEIVVDIDLEHAEPLIGVAPGQSAVLYIGTRVLGQFTIDRAISGDDTDPAERQRVALESMV